jgi:hypothetical protein
MLLKQDAYQGDRVTVVGLTKSVALELAERGIDLDLGSRISASRT